MKVEIFVKNEKYISSIKINQMDGNFFYVDHIKRITRN